MIRKYGHHKGVLSGGIFNRDVVKVFFLIVFGCGRTFLAVFLHKLLLFLANLVQLSIVFVVSFGEISGDLSMKQDVRES